MAFNCSSFSETILDAFASVEDRLDGHYPNNTESSRNDDAEAPLSINHFNTDMDTIFFPDLPGTCESLFDSYGEIDWSMYEYTVTGNNPFAPSPAPAVGDDNTSSVGTVVDPFSPVSDTTAVGPSTMPSDFKLPSPYETHITNDFGPSLNLDADAASGLSTGSPALYDRFSCYGHPSQSLFGAATDASSHAQASQGVHVSAGEVPFTFTYPPTLAIADAEEPPAVDPQAVQAESKARRTSDRRVTRRKHEPANEDSDGDDDKARKRGKVLEYPCKFCPSVFDRSYNRNVHVQAVHEGRKGYVCPHATCAQAFSRKHDLVRHQQSKHSNLGSPRRKPPGLANRRQASRSTKKCASGDSPAAIPAIAQSGRECGAASSRNVARGLAFMPLPGPGVDLVHGPAHEHVQRSSGFFAAIAFLSSPIASIDTTNNNAIIPSFEAGPPMNNPSTSMSTSSSPYTYLLSDPALTNSVGSPHSTHSPSQDDPAFYPASVNHIPLLADLLDSGGGVAGPPTTPSPFHGYGYQLSSMDAPPPPFPGESQPFPGSLALDTLSFDIPALPIPTAQFAHLPPSSSSPTPLTHPCYHCFVDLKGIRWYQCMVCGIYIKDRLSNFRDHFETHDPHRVRFDCYWPGCDLPFTRKRDQTRHIEEDHLRTRTKKSTVLKLLRAASKRNRGVKGRLTYVSLAAIF
ncbi:hypothetical protein LXA43DRAFT_1116581 [Ganoderma leucocontextum]|nr:hypothetical protein LXA43DRAFT_1116581 [Ganoderma leucocontextum]